jgi:diguanylate cyclase (GGDEF)-like protein
MHFRGNIINAVIVGKDSNCSERVAKILSDTKDLEFRVFQSSDAIESLKYIESNSPDLVYVGPGIENADMSDFYRWYRGIGNGENAALVCHLPLDSSDLSQAYDELDIIIGSDVGDVLVGEISDKEMYTRIKYALEKKKKHLSLVEEKNSLEIESVTDDLTGLRNMKGFRSDFRLLSNSLKTGSIGGVATFMMDLDHFKSVNDNYNHLVGSHIIKEVGKVIESLPTSGGLEVKARYGGDEFVIAIECSDVDEARKYGEILVERIRISTFFYEEHTLTVTASVGICFADSTFNGSEGDLLKGADLMLYESKEGGRNQASTLNISEISVLTKLEKERADRLLSGSETAEKIKALS